MSQKRQSRAGAVRIESDKKNIDLLSISNVRITIDYCERTVFLDHRSADAPGSRSPA